MRGIAFLVPYLQPALSSVSLVNTMGNVSRERMHPLRVPTRLGVEREQTELSSVLTASGLGGRFHGWSSVACAKRLLIRDR